MAPKRNVEINNCKYYKITRVIGHSPDGKAIKKQFYGHTKADAEAKMKAFMSAINNGLPVGFDKMSLARDMGKWLDNVKRASIKPLSYAKYQVCLDKVKASPIANMAISDIRATHVQEFVNGLDICPSYKRDIFTLLTGFFSYCVKADLLVKSPMGAVALPRMDAKEISTVSMGDIEKLSSYAQASPDGFVFMFLLATGLRIGELLALAPEDVYHDGDCWQVRVTKSVAMVPIEGVANPCGRTRQEIVSAPKSSASVRVVPIAKSIEPMLERHASLEKEKGQRLGFAPVAFFSKKDGARHSEGQMLYALHKLQSKLGMEKHSLHDFRHTFCTLLCKCGVSLKRAAALAGHASIEVTAKYYSHVDNEDKKADIALISRFLI
jgi:integrase